MKRFLNLTILTLLVICAPLTSRAAGTLTPVGASYAPIEIRDHHADVTINNGFAQTEVTQTFYNPNDAVLEAVYAFPLPKSASLSEVTIYVGETEINGEVVEQEEAKRIYEEERDQGRDAGLATKEEYKTFEFRVARVEPQNEVRIRFLYYQPLAIDTGVGRYVYPLQDGETDEMATQFWTTNEQVSGPFSVDLELKSAWPVDKVRVPGLDQETTVTQVSEGHYRVHFEKTNAALNRDFIFYYMLKPNLPGRVELLTYRDEANPTGTFMMVLTPGLDLQPLTGGSDYLFVLDVSGSMQTKLPTLVRGVEKALGQLNPQDRFHIVTFNNGARKLTRNWTTATESNVNQAIGKMNGLNAGGGTNLYDGIALGLKSLDADRATCFILVTDAVTNTGVIEPAAFHRLMQAYDIRFFGFLMGNSGNWPLMRTLCDASGGYSKAVSNDDDIIGQIMLAKDKITHESLHDAQLHVSGVKVFNTTDLFINKIYRGQQLVLFGQYDQPGRARLELRARKTGQDLNYTTEIEFPAVSPDHPELERLWALNQIERIELLQDIGKMDGDEGREAIVNLGLQNQIVTDHTAMLLLNDQAFEQRGIQRLNRDMIAREREARTRRANQGSQIARVDNSQPMFKPSTPSLGGGGALDPISVLLMLGTGGGALYARKRRKNSLSDQ